MLSIGGQTFVPDSTQVNPLSPWSKPCTPLSSSFAPSQNLSVASVHVDITRLRSCFQRPPPNGVRHPALTGHYGRSGARKPSTTLRQSEIRMIVITVDLGTTLTSPATTRQSPYVILWCWLQLNNHSRTSRSPLGCLIYLRKSTKPTLSEIFWYIASKIAY